MCLRDKKQGLTHGNCSDKRGLPILQVLDGETQRSVSWRREAVVCGLSSRVLAGLRLQCAERIRKESLSQSRNECYNLKKAAQERKTSCDRVHERERHRRAGENQGE